MKSSSATWSAPPTGIQAGTMPSLKRWPTSGWTSPQRDFGVSLLNDCKYGHDVKDNVMRLTLLKSGIEPDPNADHGHHEFIYSLLPHSGDWYEGQTTKEAYELNFPLRAVYADSSAGLLPSTDSFIQVKGESVILETVKKARGRFQFGAALL